MWTKTALSLPDKGVDVLVFSPDLDMIAIASLEVDETGGLYWESDSDELAASTVTDWAPLPPRPSSVD